MREMSADEFVWRLREVVTTPRDSRIAFFLGAGCSISSGIPGAGTLVSDIWLPRLKESSTGTRDGLPEWIANRFPEYAAESAATSYGTIIEDLFPSPEERQSEIERLTDPSSPGFGYSVLAQLITHEEIGSKAHVVLTTNFDDLVAAAVYMYTSRKPLVIVHESLTEFVRITGTRPLVIKLHGDAKLAPKNTSRETRALRKKLESLLRKLLKETGIVFIGYGGNDSSILKAVSSIRPPWGVWWVSEQRPPEAFAKWIESVDGTWVQHKDFDELMLLLRDAFKLPDLRERLDQSAKRYDDLVATTFKGIQDRLASRGESAASDVAIKRAAKAAAADYGTWVAAFLEAYPLEQADPDGAEKVYRQGLADFPNDAGVVGQYARFLSEIRHDDEQAEMYFKQALDLDGSDASNLGNYAAFLMTRDGPTSEAAAYLQRALVVDPNQPAVLGNYAILLSRSKGTRARAGRMFEQAIALDPTFNNRGNFAGFLLAEGELDRGMAILTSVLADVGAEDTTLQLECHFYGYAHTTDDDERVGHLAAIKQLLAQGIRSQGWDLSANVDRAIADGHPHPELLTELASVISQGADPAGLTELPGWSDG